MDINAGFYIYFVVIGLSISYAIRAIRQIRTKDYDFFNREIYTPESSSRWAVADGFLKLAFCALCLIYGVLCLIGINAFWYVPAVTAILIALYFILYRRILVKKEND